MRSTSAIVAAIVATVMLAPTSLAQQPLAEIILSPEGNHLWAFDAETGEAQLVIRAVNGGDPGVEAPPGTEPKDINGQVCVSPDQALIVTGEDTVLGPDGGPPDGGSSHDPRVAGWGIFGIEGDRIGEIRATQVGKLAPEGGQGPGYTGDPDNHGCGFLDDNRLLTGAIGDPFPGQPANGQLFLWFGPFTAGFEEVTDDGVTFFVGEVPHCSLDDTLATVGGIEVTPDGDVYVATNRPDDDNNPGGIWRYSGNFPSSFEECTPEFLAANVTKEQVITFPVLLNPTAPTPSGVVLSPSDTLYVSSVFTSHISEFTRDGTFVRDIWPTSPLAPRVLASGDTPFGMVVDSSGALWVADLGIVVAQPAPGQGSVFRITFEDGDPVLPATTIADGMTFPDGLGLYRPADRRGQVAPEPTPQPDSDAGGLPATGGGLTLAALAIATLASRRRTRA
ncbi:MAG: hypothetical protein R3249_11705 [Nitriliruptorales bacterium]|nr:hypothetical protein [Nitriliruptorales bacterium]